MINNYRVLALIPARGGSKGIKNKNLIPLCGIPLINYSIDAALNSGYIDRVLVTTDSENIADTAKEAGAYVPFLRPSELAQDNSKTIDAVLHAVKWLEEHNDIYHILILLQPTQPLRTADDIDKSIENFVRNDCKPLASVCEVNDHPLLIRTIKDGKLISILNQKSTVRRQDMDTYFKVNGCIYINLVKEINENTSFNDNIIPFIMPQSRSVDIDNINDLNIAEFYLSQT